MTDMLDAGVVAATVLALAALGGLIAERAGVFSIGLEGFMLAGAFAAVWGASVGGAELGLLTAVVAGAGFAALYALLSVTMRLDQIVAGVMLNLLALGATSFANQAIFGAGGPAPVPGVRDWHLPGLSDIPVIGEAVFSQKPFTYAAIAATIAIAIFLRRTRAGLSLKAVGEHPLAAETRGIEVVRIRWAAVIFSGAMCGLAGAALSIGAVNVFVDNMSGGRGFIALAAIIAGAWRPLWTAAACLVFGIADAAQIWADVFAIQLPHQILGMAPYLVTLVALCFLQRRPAMPAALGRPFARET